VRALIHASEKAAKIARIIKKEEELFNLLVQEKKDIEKNKRFVQDFKTLADVLIQESLKHDLSNLVILHMDSCSNYKLTFINCSIGIIVHVFSLPIVSRDGK